MSQIDAKDAEIEELKVSFFPSIFIQLKNCYSTEKLLLITLIRQRVYWQQRNKILMHPTSHIQFSSPE